VNPSASIAAASVAAGVVAEGEVVTAGGSNAEGGGFISSRFKTLLDVIADVAPLPVESSKDQRTSIDLSKFSAKSLTRTNIYAILRELVRDTQLSGIAGTAFQHPLRADNNKFAPHFTVAHEISLRINMSCLSILGEVSVNEDHCLTESSICSSIRGLLNPEAAILGVYREMLFLGEWMDASEGGCPLFSHTYMAFWLCLKACRKLVPKYPNFADVLNVSPCLFALSNVNYLRMFYVCCCIENTRAHSPHPEELQPSQRPLHGAAGVRGGGGLRTHRGQRLRRIRSPGAALRGPRACCVKCSYWWP
jgi:hypothetical protein